MKILLASLFLLLSQNIFGQADIVKSEGVTNSLHKANLGRVVFTAKPAKTEIVDEADLLKTSDLRETGDLTIRAFMDNSLTNYLHALAPELAADELVRKGSYQFSFFVDGVLIHREKLHPLSVSAENKNAKTVFAATFINPANPPDARWGNLWYQFLLNGGYDALTAGRHVLRLEMRPYLDLKVGDLIAAGELDLAITKPKTDEKQIAVQTIAPGSGWKISKDSYDKDKIAELNRKVAENLYKQITSIVVIKNGELLIEEYFNGATRETLHNTRSVGKSFASTMMGIAIGDGYIKSEDQTLKDFYDLKKFANYSAKKESVTLKSLLTMSSGFNGNDDDDSSPGNESNMYPTGDWVKFALDLPMDDRKEVGKTWNYFTAGVVVLGDVIHKSVPGGLEAYADKKLFQPLGIKNYKWEYTPQKVANTAGGLQMSALDFAKYGQLYKNGGKWNGKQIVPRGWFEKSFAKQISLGTGNADENYGYLFWNTVFEINGKRHEVFFSTGNGGNKIFVFRDQPLVIVITATAFGRWYMHRQVFNMMNKYILPAVVK